MITSLSVRVCPSLIRFKNEVNFYELQQAGHAIKVDLDPTIFNPIALTILEWQMFEILRWGENLHQSTLDAV